MSREQKEPEVGMGVTYSIGSDRYAGTISRVSKSGKTFWYRKDDVRATKAHNYYGKQSYIYIPRPDGAEIRVSKRKDGRWRESGGSCGSVFVGEREHYSDPHF